jgi:hypothetical protein
VEALDAEPAGDRLNRARARLQVEVAGGALGAAGPAIGDVVVSLRPRCDDGAGASRTSRRQRPLPVIGSASVEALLEHVATGGGAGGAEIALTDGRSGASCTRTVLGTGLLDPSSRTSPPTQ